MTIKEDLEQLPQIIYDLEKSIYEDELKNAEDDFIIKTKELNEKEKIASEVNDEGKKTYSNEISRKAELKRRLDENENFQELCKSYEDSKRDIVLRKMLLDLKKRQFRACESLARL